MLRNCLAAVDAARPNMPLEVWVIDNGSADGSLAMLQQAFPWVHVVANQHNAGFTAANNQGIRASTGRYVLLLNPDAILRPGALATLVAYLDAHPYTAVAGPQLFNGDGSLYPTMRRLPRRVTGFVEATPLQWWFGNSWVTNRYYQLDADASQVQSVGWVVGACMLVRRAAIDEVGLLDERFFMYSEELEWCWRIGRAGWQLAFVPQAQVVHLEGQSSSQNVARRQVTSTKSKLLLNRMMFGLPHMVLLAIWLAMLETANMQLDVIKHVLRGTPLDQRRSQVRYLRSLLGTRKLHP